MVKFDFRNGFDSLLHDKMLEAVYELAPDICSRASVDRPSEKWTIAKTSIEFK